MESLGRHILVEFFNCQPNILNHVSKMEEALVESAVKAGATILNSDFHHFAPQGVSGAVIIQESHLTIHTWPEYGYAAADLFTCGGSVDPWVAFDYLKETLEADTYSVLELQRGDLNLLTKKNIDFDSARKERLKNAKSGLEQPNVWYTDKSDQLALSLRSAGPLLYDKTSRFQRTRIFDTHGFGRAMMIDNMIMVTEKDETHYHEMITHPALFAHGNAVNVLVIGGGDGGAIREVLRHPNVKKVTLVEIDENVIEASQLFLPQLSAAFNDPRLKLQIMDGIEFVKTSSADEFDVILIDGTDPVGPAKGLFSESFYRDCKKCLRPGGLLVAQGESPIYNKTVFVELNQCLKNVFGKPFVKTLLYHIPTYISGIWSFQLASINQVDFLAVDEEKISQFVSAHQLNYYNYQVHQAAFMLPNYVLKMLEEV